MRPNFGGILWFCAYIWERFVYLHLLECFGSDVMTFFIYSCVQQATFSSATPLPLLVAAPGAHGHISGAHSHQPPGGAGMKLEAVMENLQRQQAARLALEEKLRSQAEKDKDIRAVFEQQQHQQELAFRHYQASVRGALAAHRMAAAAAAATRATEDSDADDERTALDDDEDERDMEEDSANDGDDFDGPLAHYAPRQAAQSGETESPKSAHALSRVQAPYTVVRQPESPNAQPQHHEWTYEEQFKQVRQHKQWNSKRKQKALVLYSKCWAEQNNKSVS